jgi:hypothetical protein
MYSKLQAIFSVLQNSCTIGSSVRFSDPDTMLKVEIGRSPHAVRVKPKTAAIAGRSRGALMRQNPPGQWRDAGR